MRWVAAPVMLLLLRSAHAHACARGWLQIFERWRVLDLKNLSAEEERSFERDKEISTRIYNSVRAENHLRLAVHAHV